MDFGKVINMSDEDFKKEIDDLKAKLKDSDTKNSDISKALDDIKAMKADLVKNRDELKKELAANKDKKDTDGATVEELKKLLIDQKAETDKVSKSRKSDKFDVEVEKVAKKAGFVLDKDGNVNMKLLKSQIDFDSLVMDDNGNIFGVDQQVANLKEKDPFFFPKKQAPKGDPKIDPKTVKGDDLSDAKFEKSSFAEQVAMMKKRGERSLKEQENNGLPPGMTMANRVDVLAGAGSEGDAE